MRASLIPGRVLALCLLSAALASGASAGGAGPDTVRFGHYQLIGGDPYAIPGERWTFDHGSPDPLEGWTVEDLTSDPEAYFRVVTATSWAGHGNGAPCPVIHPGGTAWVGRFQDEADAAGYAAGLGYGNEWTQQFTSPSFSIAGSGDLILRIEYFSDLALDGDQVEVKIVTLDGEEIDAGDPIVGLHEGDPVEGTWTEGLFAVPAVLLVGVTECRVRIVMTSDATLSDEDGGHDTVRGPFGFGRLSARRSGPILAQFFDHQFQLEPTQAINGASGQQVGHAVCVIDVNLDGYDDVFIGDPSYSGGQGEEGRVLGYYGGPNGIFEWIASWSAESNVAGARFGSSLAAGYAGVNNTIPMIVVGAPFYSGGQQQEGKLYLFPAIGSGGLEHSPIWTYESDVAGSYLGWSVSCGDWSGDDLDDIAAGAPYYANGQVAEGRIYGWNFNDLFTAPTWIRESDQAGCYLGRVIYIHRNCVLTGVPFYNGAPGIDCGAIEVRNPSTGNVVNRVLGTRASSHLGRSIAPVGDIDGQGEIDYAVTEELHDVFPALHILTWLGLYELEPYVVLEDPSFASSIGAAGDIESDGIHDLVMSGYTRSDVRVIDLDNDGGVSWRESWSVPVLGTDLDVALHALGDIDQNGENDLVIGLPDYSVGGAGGRAEIHLRRDTDDAGWTGEPRAGVGSHVGVASVNSYSYLPSGDCEFAGWVLECHDDEQRHPEGQWVRLVSPIVDRALLDPAHDRFIARADVFWREAVDAGVLLRAGWQYYPYANPDTGAVGWSPAHLIRGGWETATEGCSRPEWIAEGGDGPSEVPPSAEKIRFFLEVYAPCLDGSLIPTSCSVPDNESPLFDNMVIEAIDTGSISGDVRRSFFCPGAGDPLPNVPVWLIPTGEFAWTGVDGRFTFYGVVPGSYNVSVIPPSNWMETCHFHNQVDFDGTPVRDVTFGLNLEPDVTDLAVWIGGGRAKRGFSTFYAVSCRNLASQAASAPLVVHLHPDIEFELCDEGGVYQASDHTVNWASVPLAPGGFLDIYIQGKVSTGAFVGGELVTTVDYGPPSGDGYPLNNHTTCTQTVVSALDPNDKQVSPAGAILLEQTLSYQVNFQNVGTASATDVRVEDVLDETLDLSTLQFGATSHAPTAFYLEGRKLVWRFDGLELPDSTSNEPGSHGFVTFSARPSSGLEPGAVITNRARIYFDFEAPVETNVVTSTIADPAGVEAPSDATEFALRLVGSQPAQGYVEMEFVLPSRGQLSARVHDVAGRVIGELASGSFDAGVTRLRWDPTAASGQVASAGVYFVRAEWSGAGVRSAKTTRLVIVD